MALSPEVLKRLHGVFNDELEEQSRAMIESLLQLEQSHSDDALRQQLMEPLFRAGHNIKGAASGVQLKNIAAVAHQLESLFTRIGKVKGRISPACVDFCLENIDLIRQMMAAENNDTPLDVDMAKLTYMAATIEVEFNQDNPTPEPTKKPSPSQDSASDNQQDSNPSSSQPGPEPARLVMDTEVIRIKMDKITHIDSLSEDIQVDKMAMENHLARLTAVGHECQSLSDQVSNLAMSGHLSEQQWQHQYQQLQEQNQNAINRLNQEIKRFVADFRVSTNQLNAHSNSLQSSVRMLRLVPASSLLQGLGLVVRDIAKTLEKSVHFSVVGEDIEIDRTVLEGLKDPLTHLLRNAIDHGLETPAQRQAAGKDATGRIVLELQRDGSEIVIEVSDDGGGINLDKVHDQAIKNKLYTETELEFLPAEDLIDTIFMPGFSTKSIITDISGRGVGMDVVAQSLVRLKGQISVKSEAGQGTCFSLRVPVTMATERGLMVRLGHSRYVIPTQSILRVMEIKPDDIIEVEACHTIYHDNKPMPLCDLAELLGLPASNSYRGPRRTADESQLPAPTPVPTITATAIDNTLLPLVLVSKGWNTVAFVVDEIEGETEVIVKPLQPPLISVANISGGAIMGDGEIVMVLDANDIVEHGLSKNVAQQRSLHQASHEEKPRPRLLIADDSITVRTLEQNILQAQGYDVTTAADGKQAWELIQRQPFDLIVTDIEMPQINGFELTRYIKQSNQYQHIPVVMVTSLAQEHDKQKGIEVGANAYIAKGQFETKSLLEIIAQLLLTHGIETA
ncbi:MAG: two-component system chemotaxis sensor kinase CheA [Phenylobacterium sp.]|jgi:two-component system chemotaxis sensor kinase CheA